MKQNGAVIMTGMTSPIRKSDIARAGATPEFEELCKALYGDSVDPQAVWDDVIKASPDQADVNAGGRLRRNVERTSNAVGITAGGLGLAAAMRDERLKGGGKVARTLYRTGQKMPSVVGRIKSPKVQAGLAAGAVATQVANLGGDALIAGTLGQSPKKDKVGKRLVPTGEVFKLAGGPSIPKAVKDAAAGLRRAWNPQAAGAAPKATQPTLPGMGSQTPRFQRAKAAGEDVMSALNTTTGKVMAGGIAATGAVKGNRAMRQNSGGVDYVPDYETYGKNEDGTADVVFKGVFSEIDQDKRTAFGWASVVKINGQPVVDRQGDYIDLEDLEKAAYDYVHKSRVGGDMHRRLQDLGGDRAHKVSDMIESIVFTPEKIAKMGLPSDFPQGWWVGYKIHDDETWDLVKKGERTGFSIHGKGLRKAANIDEILGYNR